MKLLYCIHSLYNPGGMERVLLNKATWLSAHGWDVMVATTDQHDRPSFYPFPEQIKMIDLGVNYSDDNGKNFILKTLGYFRRRRMHRCKLVKLLRSEHFDIVDCLYPGECSFVPAVKDGSKKVMELHQSKLFHYQYNRSGLMGLADKYRAWADERLVRRFDRFVALTEEDRQMWGEFSGIRVIPNAAKFIADSRSDSAPRRVIAVGRLDYQKSFDRLIGAWAAVRDKISALDPSGADCSGLRDWRLDIFGQGEWREMLEKMIADRGIGDSIALNPPTKNIGAEYAASSILVMSSHYEGFPMVMIEAMACGLPVVSFDFKCGPRDIITDGADGLIVPDGDIYALADAMIRLMSDDELRTRMSEEAVKVTERYGEETVMSKWVELYNELVGGSSLRPE